MTKILILTQLNTIEERAVEITGATKNWKLIVKWLSQTGLPKGGYVFDIKLNRLRLSERGKALDWKCGEEEMKHAIKTWKELTGIR